MGTNATDLIVQGDVFITWANIPAKAKRITHRPLAYGEVTGHSHQVADKDCEMYELDGVLYLKTDRTARVNHEEHKPVTIPAGTWKVGIVKEYDAFEEEARNVRD